MLFVERHYSKQEILLAYFTPLRSTGKYRGSGSAARIYFCQTGKELTRLECMAPWPLCLKIPLREIPYRARIFDEARIRLAALMAEGERASPLKVRSLARSLPLRRPTFHGVAGQAGLLWNDQGIARSFIEQDLQNCWKGQLQITC